MKMISQVRKRSQWKRNRRACTYSRLSFTLDVVTLFFRLDINIRSGSICPHFLCCLRASVLFCRYWFNLTHNFYSDCPHCFLFLLVPICLFIYLHFWRHRLSSFVLFQICSIVSLVFFPFLRAFTLSHVPFVSLFSLFLSWSYWIYWIMDQISLLLVV